MTIAAFSRHNHLSELNDPLIGTGEGTISPTSRRSKALTNLTGGVTMTAAQLAFTAGVTAGTAAASKALVADSAIGIGGGWRDTRTQGIFKQVAPAAKTTSTTLTAAELLTGLITANQGAAGAATYTLPLATDLETALVAAFPGLANDDAFDFVILNISTNAAEDVTVATNTGWTLVGELVVPSNDTAGVAPSNAVFRVRRTGANAYTLYRVA